MSYLAFSKSVAGFLTEKAGLDQEKEAVLSYAIEVLVLSLGNILLTLLLAWLLGVLPGVLSCLTAAFLFRHTAGGAHSGSSWRCAAVTVTIYPVMALAAVYLARLGATFIDLLSAVALLTGLIAIAALAPVDSPAAPIISPRRRRKLKVFSLGVLALVAAAVVFFRQSHWVYATQIQVCLALTVLWISFLLGKPGHSAMRFIDHIKLKEV